MQSSQSSGPSSRGSAHYTNAGNGNSQQMNASDGSTPAIINWSLLWKRSSRRAGQLFTALRFRAGQTDYVAPAWSKHFRFSWFRLGLAGIAVFVFTQKQINFSIQVGRNGIKTGQSVAANGQTDRAGVLATAFGGGGASANKWVIETADVATVRAYINRFRKVAIAEHEKYGIPVAANLALAIRAGHAGTLAGIEQSNNHFGPVMTRLGDGGDYPSAWANWRAHSEVIGSNFPQLAAHRHDYRAWLDALPTAGYPGAEQAGFRRDLDQIIQQYQLAND